MKISDVNIYWKNEETVCHILRCGINAQGEIFVHFVSKERGSVQTSDPLIDSMPDHVSFHKDGTIHIKHKDGHRTRYPISLKSGLLETPSSKRLMFLAVSYYKKNFDAYRAIMKVSHKDGAEQEAGAFVIEPTDSFTILFFLEAMPENRIDERDIDVWCFPGTLPIEERPDSIVPLDEGNVVPLLNCRPMPTWDLIEPLATGTHYPDFSI